MHTGKSRAKGCAFTVDLVTGPLLPKRGPNFPVTTNASKPSPVGEYTQERLHGSDWRGKSTTLHMQLPKSRLTRA